MWKNYGNGHTIFDASNSTSPQGGGVNNTNSDVAWSATYPTLMGWNGVNTYGVRVDSARRADSAGSADSATSATTAGSANFATTAGSAPATAASVYAAIAGSDYGEVGTYVFAGGNNVISPGSTLAGSSLKPTNADGDNLSVSTLSGTWRLMGGTNTVSGSFGPDASSLWVRTV
jgi:hypothetical protein